MIASQEIAIVTKNKGLIQYKKVDSETIINKISPGLELYNNDLLQTGNTGFVIFAYLDDGSLVKIHKDSKVYVNGDLKNNIINKEINVNDGFLLFDIKKQKANEFKVVTPSSVASVKGTIFILEVTENGDIFYGLEGNVEVINKETNTSAILQKNKKVSSSLDGVINVENITAKDIDYIKQVQQDSGIEIDEINQSGIGDASTDLDSNVSETKELVIKLTNALGEEKRLIIKFNE